MFAAESQGVVMGNLFARAWQGKASLAAAFWIIWFLGTIILSIIIVIVLSAIDPNFNFVLQSFKTYSILFPYTVFAAICVWRCGRNSIGIWRFLSRLLMIFAVIGGLFNIYAWTQASRTPTTTTTTTTTTMPTQQ